jgi:hypothetical protein
MKPADRKEMCEKLFEQLRTSESRADLLLLIQSYEDEITELIFERQNLIHQITENTL